MKESEADREGQDTIEGGGENRGGLQRSNKARQNLAVIKRSTINGEKDEAKTFSFFFLSGTVRDTRKRRVFSRNKA